jgi:hypothetical protein
MVEAGFAIDPVERPRGMESILDSRRGALSEEIDGNPPSADGKANSGQERLHLEYTELLISIESRMGLSRKRKGHRNTI